jgi:hypothetical protein
MLIAMQTPLWTNVKETPEPRDFKLLCLCTSQKDGTPCSKLVHARKQGCIHCYGVVIFVGSIRPLSTDADGLRHRLHGPTFFDILFLPGSLIGTKYLFEPLGHQ